VPHRFDAVVCACAFCTFPDKPAAEPELARILRPGGRVGITDVTVNGALPAALNSLAAWVACIAAAQPEAEYIAILDQAGLTVTHTETHQVLERMIDEIQARLRLLQMTSPQRLTAAGITPRHRPGLHRPDQATLRRATHRLHPHDRQEAGPSALSQRMVDLPRGDGTKGSTVRFMTESVTVFFDVNETLAGKRTARL
jgi:SAM-dependent methyltransferase